MLVRTNEEVGRISVQRKSGASSAASKTLKKIKKSLKKIKPLRAYIQRLEVMMVSVLSSDYHNTTISFLIG